MKVRFLFMLLGTCLFGSCVFVEEVDTPQKGNKVEWVDGVYQSRASDNIMIVAKDEPVTSQVDWKSDWQDAMSSCLPDDDKADVYAYNGEGGTFTFKDGIPALKYEQTEEWVESQFQYVVSESKNLLEDTDSIEFKDAFGYIKFQISNNEESLHLQVKDIRLCRIAKGGTFVFPTDDESAYWTDLRQGGLTMTADTMQIGCGTKTAFPAEGMLPVIPQNVGPWDTVSFPGFSTGAYLLLNCRIFHVKDKAVGYQEGKEYPIWCGQDGGFAEVVIPVEIDVQMAETQTISLTLKAGCDWYSVNDNVVRKILQPIMFAPSLEDWENGGDVNIEAE